MNPSASFQSETMDNDHQISKYDRLYGGLHEVTLHTKPSTIKNVQFTGRTSTYIVETKRSEDGDYIFVECMDETGVIRLALPPRVSNAIAAERDGLTRRRRSISSKAVMKKRMDALPRRKGHRRYKRHAGQTPITRFKRRWHGHSAARCLAWQGDPAQADPGGDTRTPPLSGS